jgi:nucleoside-diphosphate-sugar epimerase
MLKHLSPAGTRPNRVVVVGGQGFVGGALTSRLKSEGIQVLPIGRIDVDLLSPGADERLADLLAEDDIVVAASAIAPCKNSEMLRDNIIMSLAMKDAFAKVKLAHVINISSDAVFADLPLPLTEQSPMAPETFHGVMHLAREIMFANDIKTPLAILRPTLIYGATDPHNGYGPNKFRRLANRGEDIVLFGKGEERRDHVLVDDVAEIVMRVICRRSTGSLNIASGVVTSFRNAAEIAVKLAGKPIAIREAPRLGPMPHNGYRPFDISACSSAFPDFSYTQFAHGMALAQRQEFPNG